jgi:4-hydroxy-tetrahydrodipicolinate reductase
MTKSSVQRVCVAGASGRMGRMLVEAISDSTDCQLSGALDMPASAAIGQDPAAFLGQQSGVVISADLHAGLQGANALIDFTRPEGTLAHLAGVPSPGGECWSSEPRASTMRKRPRSVPVAKDIAIVMAPNMSVGVNVT